MILTDNLKVAFGLPISSDAKGYLMITSYGLSQKHSQLSLDPWNSSNYLTLRVHLEKLNEENMNYFPPVLLNILAQFKVLSSVFGALNGLRPNFKKQRRNRKPEG